jgi:H+/gluconate symporter-like permease
MSTATATEDPTALRLPSYGRGLLIANAVIAWVGVAISFTLSVSGYYLGDEDPTKESILGNIPAGHDTALERFLDWSTYFTIWSNITVAVVLTVLLARPHLFTRQDRVGGVWRALRLDTVLMITIVGALYWLLLAEGGKTGWDLVSNHFVHTITPIVTVLVWIIAGPRGLFTRRTIAPALVLPLVWAAYAILRGTVVGAYPYPFLDVSTKGLVSVLTFLVMVVVIGVVFSFVFLGIERLRDRRRA